MKLTEVEIQNGWTHETLSRYLKEREKAQGEVIFDACGFGKKRKPLQQNHKYNPLRWRG